MPRRWKRILLAVLAIVVVFYGLLLFPPVQGWIGWRVAALRTRLTTWLRPPENISFAVQVIPESDLPLPTPLPEPEPTLVPIDSTLPLPSAFALSGTTYYSQHNRWNYCGPANLAMLLSYWGLQVSPDALAAVIKPYQYDKNVMPYEMVEYINTYTATRALVRVGGDFDLIKRFISAGFPVMVEKGPRFRDIQYRITWMGHYQVLTGFDDNKQVFIAQDSYIKANHPQPYDELLPEWRSFNYTYIVAYPPHKENDVLNILGVDADVEANYRRALEKAGNEIPRLEGVDQFFSYYNYGTNLVALRDYAGAAKAYDQAFALYDALPVEGTVRPYRILWYQTGPYFAYYYTGRYADVVRIATQNSIQMVRDDEPALEESFYWRALAQVKLGERDAAVEDFQTCLKYHPGFVPCQTELNNLGIFP